MRHDACAAAGTGVWKRLPGELRPLLGDDHGCGEGALQAAGLVARYERLLRVDEQPGRVACVLRIGRRVVHYLRLRQRA